MPIAVDKWNDYFKEDHKKITNFFVDGKCSECGGCCSRFLPVSQKELNTIKAYCKNHGIKPSKHGMFAMNEPVMDLLCPFLDDAKLNHKCRIYEVRPKICRIFTCANPCNPNVARKMHEAGCFPVDMQDYFKENL